MGLRGEVFSTKLNTEKRTYFFNVKENRHGDLFLNIVESKKQGDIGGYDRQSVIVFEEELENFTRELDKALEFIRKKS